MTAEYPYVCRYTHGEAVRLHEEELWDRSFRENVCCARVIEKALRECKTRNEQLAENCAAPVLEEYGHRRVSFVLAQTIQKLSEIPSLREMLGEGVRKWAKENSALLDPTYGRYYSVDTAIVLLNSFVRQTQEAYHMLGLFGREHCAAGMYDRNVEGKVLVLSPDTLKESSWTPQDQLWLATGGFGCEPKASGRAIYATCLGDNKEARWNREDFCGVLDEQYLPDWAKEKLEAIRTPRQGAQETAGMSMG